MLELDTVIDNYTRRTNDCLHRLEKVDSKYTVISELADLKSVLNKINGVLDKARTNQSNFNRHLSESELETLDTEVRDLGSTLDDIESLLNHVSSLMQ